MLSAFKSAVASLRRKLGRDPGGWTWGKLHTLEIDSILGSTSLGCGPQPSPGDQWTVNLRHGGDYTANAGPSWRTIVDWGSRQGEAVYPGGESEDFHSPWAKNMIDAWWNGR